MKKKKFDIKVVDMCIYIDNNVYEKDHDVAKIFDYLQRIYCALAKKKRFFSSEEDYNNYSLYSATQIYMRLTAKKQFGSDDSGKKLKPIKSVLNYIKKTLYPFKVNYQNISFTTIHNNNTVDDSCLLMKASLDDIVMQNCYNDFLNVDVSCYLNNIHKSIWNILKEYPYTSDKALMNRLYMSCLLTLLRSITISNENKEKLFVKNSDEFKVDCDNILESIYYEESLTAPVTWHLPTEYENLVAVIVNRIKNSICKDIRYIMSYYVPSDDIIKDILSAPVSDQGIPDYN